MSTHATTRIVGAPVPRKEGVDKLLGRACYVDDMEREGMWYGATVRSTIPRGLIRSIAFDRRIDWSEFTVVTAADIPGENIIQLIVADQPCLADGKVNHCEEPILLLAHPDKHKLREAVGGGEDRVRSAAARSSPLRRASGRIKSCGARTICSRVFCWKRATWTLRGPAPRILSKANTAPARRNISTSRTRASSPSTARRTASRCGARCNAPTTSSKSLRGVFDLPEDKVRVIQTETGGAFGGKEDYPSILACHAALLAMKSGHPVKMVYDRMEDLAATTKRHPARVRHRTALDKDGKLLAMEIDLDTDGGAYATLSSTVLSRATLHSTGPYLCPNVRVRARSWATNHVPYGAFRGFGAPQAVFAMERHMDEIAAALGMDPVELRRRNFLHEGDTNATEQLMREPIILDKLLDRALQASDYHAKRAQFARENALNPIKRGMGIAAFYHGSGFTGSGELYLNSLGGVDVTLEGKVRVLVSNTEFGQGTNTILTQIAAEALGIEYSDVTMAAPDTDMVPNSGPTVASRTSMVVGRLIERACLQLLSMLREHPGLGPTHTRRRISCRL